jgi:two-component system response regulator DesR
MFFQKLKYVIGSSTTLKVSAQAKDGQEAVKTLQSLDIDVDVLDLNIPSMTGLELAEQILQTSPHLPLILLTVYMEEAHFIRALEVILWAMY